jgi:hypothetical protein
MKIDREKILEFNYSKYNKIFWLYLFFMPLLIQTIGISIYSFNENSDTVRIVLLCLSLWIAVLTAIETVMSYLLEIYFKSLVHFIACVSFAFIAIKVLM